MNLVIILGTFSYLVITIGCLLFLSYDYEIPHLYQESASVSPKDQKVKIIGFM